MPLILVNLKKISYHHHQGSLFHSALLASFVKSFNQFGAILELLPFLLIIIIIITTTYESFHVIDRRQEESVIIVSTKLTCCTQIKLLPGLINAHTDLHNFGYNSCYPFTATCRSTTSINSAHALLIAGFTASLGVLHLLCKQPSDYGVFPECLCNS